ncbi:MAG: DUF1800 domain-containing protein [Bacteroidetes bacterium]|nr:DUF1800 domain-containing protein [Bacteroidota bacterium]
MVDNKLKIKHLYWRAAFGPPLNTDYSKWYEYHLKKIFDGIVPHQPVVIDYWNHVKANVLKDLSDEAKAQYRKNERRARFDISEAILDRYTGNNNLLREKMTLFWMGHFACRTGSPPLMCQYYNTISENALGSFVVLLKAMIRNASLLQYLNNNQNRKAHPNENFSRELMELFSLGRSNYSEEDVQEAARALTGWGFNSDGDFLMRKDHHDFGTKTIFGQTGNFDGDDVIDLIINKNESARFIVTKIYKYFVNENIDPQRIDELVINFKKSGYHIGELMKSIFSSSWFSELHNIGCKIKSPVELVTGISRDFKVQFFDSNFRLNIYGLMGQVLFNPPNVAGWPGGKTWIDSSTLIFRNRLPKILLSEAPVTIEPKKQFDALENETMIQKPGKVKIAKTGCNFEMFLNATKSYSDDQLYENISKILNQKQPNEEVLNIIRQFTVLLSGDDKKIKTAIYLMSLPEYQLC